MNSLLHSSRAHCTVGGAAYLQRQTTVFLYRATHLKERSLHRSKGASQFITARLVKADSHIACRAHAVPLPCRAVNSHMPCRAHAVPLPCPALIHTCHDALLPCSYSAVSFVKFRMVAGNIRTASPTV
jgi:hypothetical protein